MYALERRDALEQAKVKTYLTLKSGEISKKYEVAYTCKSCKSQNHIKEVQVDHITPIGPMPDFLSNDFGTWINSLFCPIDNLQVLCKPCHVKKSKKDKVNMKRADKSLSNN